MSIHEVSKCFLALQQVFSKLGTHVMPTSIWNMDETRLQLDFKPPKIVAARGAKLVLIVLVQYLLKQVH